MPFVKDRKRGEDGEDRVIELLRSYGVNAERDSKKEHDIFATFDEFSFHIEVKNDIYAAKSGNIAIEVYNPKKDALSGLSITKAQLWAHITDDIYFANTEILRKYTEEVSPLRVIEAGGDKNATLLLYKHNIIIPSIFHSISSLEPSAAREKLKEILCIKKTKNS